MTSFTTTCPDCGTSLRLDVSNIGANTRCSACQTVFPVSNVGFTDGPQTDETPQALMTRSEPVAEPSSPAAEKIATVQPSQDALKITAIGRYEIQRELGRGAFGVVYVAHDPVLNRQVAIKVLSRAVEGHNGRGPVTDDSVAESLVAEARAAARLRHPNIVAVFEAGTHEGVPFIVSELIQGQSLADHISIAQGGREVPAEPSADGDNGMNSVPRWAATLIRDLARGLGHAHAGGLVHRDIKPQNILVGEDGRPQITDFGLAVDRSDETQASQQAYSRSGTLAYMAPEQAGVGAASVGPAVDQYALGACLFEMLTGHRPHDGDSLEILQGLEAELPPRASQHAKGIPLDLDAICFKAMAHDPWNRYKDCDQLADDLDRFLRGDLIHGRHIGWIERARHFSKRNPKIAAWSTAAAVAGVALLLASSAYAVRTQFVVRYLDKENQRIERDARQSVNQLSQQWAAMQSEALESSGATVMSASQPGTLLDPADRELPGWLAYSRKMQKVAKSLAYDDRPVASRLLDESLEPYRDWEHGYLQSAVGTPSASWSLDDPGSADSTGNTGSTGHAATNRPVDSVATLADPRYIGIHRGSSFSVREIATGHEQQATSIPQRQEMPQNYRFRTLQNAPVVAFADGNDIRFWNFVTSEELPSIAAGGQCQLLDISSDDRWLALYEQSEGSFQLWNLETREKAGQIDRETVENSHPSASAGQTPSRNNVPKTWARFFNDGQLIFLQYNDVVLRVAYPGGEVTRWQIPGVDELLHVDPSMTHVIYKDRDGNLMRSDAAGIEHGYSGERIYDGDISWDRWPPTRVWVSQPDQGEPVLAIHDGNGHLRLIRGGQEKRLPFSGWDVPAIGFSASGRFLVMGSGHECTAWDMEQLFPQATSNTPDSAIILATTQSTDGQYLATVGMNGQTTLWSVAENRIVWSTAGSTGYHYQRTGAVAFHPNRQIVASGGEDGIVRLWSIDKGEPAGQWQPLPKPIQSLAFSPDGTQLAVGLHASSPVADPDERYPIPEPAARRQANPQQVTLVSFQPPAADTTTPDDSSDILVLSATNGQWVQRLQSHRHGVNGLAFNADGSQLASSGDDGRVLLWQLGTDQPVAEYDCQGDRPNSLRLSPDGQRFAFVAATTVTKYLTQTRTRTVNVSKCRVEERTREYQVEFTRMESKTISRDVDYDGHLVKQEYSVLVPTTAMETKTVTDAVQVPYTEQVEQTYTVPVPVTEAFSSNPNGDRPRVIAVSASDLQELGRWYPEGNRTPYALTFADSGRRMFVSTDRGVSVLHPGYLFELVDLRIGDAGSATPQHLGELHFSQAHGRLSVTSVGSLVALSHWGERDESYWTSATRPRSASDDMALSAGQPTLATISGQMFRNQPAAAVPAEAQPVQPPAPRLNLAADVPADQDVVKLADLNFDQIRGVPMAVGSPAAWGPVPDSLAAPPRSRYTLRIPTGWATFHTLVQLQPDSSPEPAPPQADVHLYQPAAAAFVVRGDGKTLYRSPIIRDNRPYGIKLDIRGVSVLELITETVAGSGHASGDAARPAIWLEPELRRQPAADVFQTSFDEWRITAKNIGMLDFKITPQGFQRVDNEDDDMSLVINGAPWTPRDQARFPGDAAAQPPLFGPDHDLRRARVHLYDHAGDGDLAYRYQDDHLRIRLTGLVEGTLVIQVPKLDAATREIDPTPNWQGNWRVAGWKFASDSQPRPDSIPPEGEKRFGLKDFSSIDWTWHGDPFPFTEMPRDRFVLVGERRFVSDGGLYYIETLGREGLRVKLDGQVVVDQWDGSEMGQGQRWIQIPAGRRALRLEYANPQAASRVFVHLRCMQPNGAERELKSVAVAELSRQDTLRPVAIDRLRALGAIVHEDIGAVLPTALEIDLSAAESPVDEPVLRMLAALPELRRLTIGANTFASQSWQRLEALPALNELTLIDLELGDDSLQAIASLDRLAVLRFEAVDITDEQLKEIATMENLRELHLWYAPNVTQASVETFRSMAGLQNLVLGATKLSDSSHREITEGNTGLSVHFAFSNWRRNPQNEQEELGQRSDRLAAALILERDRSVDVYHRDNELVVASFGALPQGKILLRGVNVQYSPRFDDADMTWLLGLRGLRSINLSGSSKITDAGLRCLHGMNSLEDVSFSHTQVTDEGIDALLASLEQAALSSIGMNSTPLSDRTLLRLHGKTTLREIYIAATQVTDTGLDSLLASLDEVPITHLDLSSTPITDHTMQHLRHFQLSSFRAAETRIGDDGISHLTGKDRKMWICDLRGTQITDKGLEGFADAVDGYLYLDRTAVTGAGLAHLAGGSLRTLSLTDTEITDQGLEHLTAMEDLKAITLRGTQVTDTGVERLKGKFPDCQVTR